MIGLTSEILHGISNIKEERMKKLPVSILGAIAEATDTMEIESTDCGTLHFPELRHAPVFEFTDEDIQLIKSLSEESMEDFSMLTES